MSISYAEVTIIKNLDKERINHYVGRLFGQEIMVTDDDTIIIEFDDGTIVDTSDLNEDIDNYSNSDTDTDIISCTNSNIESKYGYDELDDNSRIILLPGIYIPQKSLQGFIVDRKLFNLNIPNSVSLLFGTKYTISYKNLFNKQTTKNFSKKDPNLKTVKVETSMYNMIYSCMSEYDSLITIDSFGIAKIQSSELKPRFIVAYRDDYFKKNDIIYLVDHIFKYKF